MPLHIASENRLIGSSPRDWFGPAAAVTVSRHWGGSEEQQRSPQEQSSLPIMKSLPLSRKIRPWLFFIVVDILDHDLSKILVKWRNKHLVTFSKEV